MDAHQKGDHVKIEVTNERSSESEWMWLLVNHSGDEQRRVFGALDSEPIVARDMRRGQELAVSYDQVREHRKFDQFGFSDKQITGQPSSKWFVSVPNSIGITSV
jgi:hypothetical protein